MNKFQLIFAVKQICKDSNFNSIDKLYVKQNIVQEK